MDRKQSEQWQSRVSRTVNSAACFSLAYVSLTYMMWLVTGMVGRLFGLDSFVYYYGIKFILNGQVWDKAKIATVYSAGPLFCLFTALFCVFLYSRMKTIKSLLNVFFLWVFVVGISIFLSQVIFAAMGLYRYRSYYYEGLAVTFSWLKTPKFIVYALAASVVFFIIYFGTNIARRFLVFSYSYSKINSITRRRKYFFETALAPFILGAAVTIVAVFPRDMSAIRILVLLATAHIFYLVIIGLILGIGWISLTYVEIAKPELVRYKSLQIPSIVAVVLMLILWAYVYMTFRGLYLAG